MKKTEIKIQNETAGWLTQDENGYHFVYDEAYIQKLQCRAYKSYVTIKRQSFYKQNAVSFNNAQSYLENSH